MKNREEEQETCDSGRMITFTRKYFDDRVRGAFNDGLKLKHSELSNFLFSICEFYSYAFRPANIPMKKFLKFTIDNMMEEFELRYCEPKKKKKKPK